MPPYVRWAVTVLVLTAIVGAIALLQSSHRRPASIALAGNNASTTSAVVPLDDVSKSRITEKKKTYKPAVDISTPDAFINSEPFTVKSLIGKKIILIDFWTYSCINCERTLPYLNSWYSKYEDEGLVIIGVHTPEFEFEQKLENVQRAVEKFGIKYPVVLDNDYSTWSGYGNQYWPRKYLIDIDGFIVYDHIGEGGYDETETKIVELLNERKKMLGENGGVTVNAEKPKNVDTVHPSSVQSPETYLGQKRIQYLANIPNQSCLLGSCTYTFSGMTDFEGYELSGAWKIDAEYATLQKGTGAIRIHFSADKVNLVAGSDTPVRAKILIDGEVVTTASRGSNVQNGIVTFTTHELYNLINLQGNPGDHILEIQFLSPGIAAFAFTFG